MTEHVRTYTLVDDDGITCRVVLERVPSQDAEYLYRVSVTQQYGHWTDLLDVWYCDNLDAAYGQYQRAYQRALAAWVV